GRILERKRTIEREELKVILVSVVAGRRSRTVVVSMPVRIHSLNEVRRVFHHTGQKLVDSGLQTIDDPVHERPRRGCIRVFATESERTGRDGTIPEKRRRDVLAVRRVPSRDRVERTESRARDPYAGRVSQGLDRQFARLASTRATPATRRPRRFMRAHL